jgi:hypothetical protein
VVFVVCCGAAAAAAAAASAAATAVVASNILLVFRHWFIESAMQCWYWEPVDMLRKLSLTGLLQLVQRGSAFQVMLGCSISCVFAIMQQRVLPYARAEANALKTLVEGEIFLTFLITFILRTESINTEYFGPSFYGSLLIVSLLLVVLGSVGIVAKQACRKRQFGTRLLEGIEFENVTTTGGGGNLHEMPSIVSMQHATTASPPSRP